ncbi:uncharacterized protein OCT59_025315 [Rhizophagus irregularis]|uniref:Uncharacterized protein n=1 Tax=Rhizophagus irregularis (strain DAOM 181602 / DAOM 197198 / MUCL 43194) TaxID=747089 RepID=U9T2H7_RHIID|nr:hypothetical protein OCT59_025315 [Rhizophagus irregularis]GBC11663.1 hypothetical protein RIR_jg34532.t1 [Rhizophagus irregularis DAOM 181602=DAOM 197198]CAG8720946.1 6031_t:CDS:1 [Rhizophagus irregularis]
MYRKKFSTYTTKQTVPSLCAATVKPVVSERTFSISPQSSTSSIVGRMRQSISDEFTNPNNQSVEAFSKSQRKGLGCHCPPNLWQRPYNDPSYQSTNESHLIGHLFQ